MGLCSKGKSCGASCISRSLDCRVNLSEDVSRAIKKTARGVLKSVEGAEADEAVFDDISRLLRGEEPKVIPYSRGEVTKLQSALGLGEQTRQEVGDDYEVLKAEALRRKEELRAEIKKQRVLGTSKAKVREKELQEELDKIKAALKNETPVPDKVKEARIQARYFDRDFYPERSISGTKSDFDWEETAKKGTGGAKGGFGTVLFLGDSVSKRGEIGAKEIDVLKKVGEADLGPRLIYGEIGKRVSSFGGSDIHEGRIAMTRVPGREIDSPSFSSPGDKVGNTSVSNAYWRARADLHRLGIAHNDAHGSNVIVDDSGKPRFVDFGLSQDNPKAALSEAFGAIVNKSVLPIGALLPGGMKRDVQALKVKNSGINEPASNRPESLSRIYENLTEVKKRLRRLGMSKDEIAQVMASGTRNPESFYNKGAWGKLSNSDSMEIINLLYNGI